MSIATLGIDLGKNPIHVVGLDEGGQPVERKKLTRTSLIRFLAKLTPCRVAMEACAGSHHVARKAEAMGHRPVILPGQFVQAYAKGQKNDEADAAAIAEAATRPTMPVLTCDHGQRPRSPPAALSSDQPRLGFPGRSPWAGNRLSRAGPGAGLQGGDVGGP